VQTVPTCQNLYKNSFHYHTVSSKPPDYNECFSYLGMHQLSVLSLGCASRGQKLMLMEFHLLAAADSVQQEKGRVLVHCMTGTSMYVPSFYSHHTCMSSCIIADMMYPRCRSPSVVIGYLMRLRRWRLNESYKWVHDRRACVSLQEGKSLRPFLIITILIIGLLR